MLDVRYASRFKKDIRNCARRHLEIGRLEQVIETLRIPAPLPPKDLDHGLTGDYIGYRECHVGPDWLLIYRYDGDELLLYRTGTHTDLFGHDRKR